MTTHAKKPVTRVPHAGIIEHAYDYVGISAYAFVNRHMTINVREGETPSHSSLLFLIILTLER